MATEQKEIAPTPWAPAANVGAIFFSERTLARSDLDRSKIRWRCRGIRIPLGVLG
jgi:hypothetical protein